MMRMAVCFIASVFTTLAGAETALRLEPVDLSIENRKFVGATIETRMQCFNVRGSDFRCVDDNGPIIEFIAADPPETLAMLARRCDTLTKAASPRCRFKIRFVYGDGAMSKDSDGGSSMFVFPRKGLITFVK